MGISSIEVGHKIVLKGKSRHGKQRVDIHGSDWTVNAFGNFNGHDAIRVESQNATFNIGRGKKIRDQRWVFLKEDPNFIYFY